MNSLDHHAIAFLGVADHVVDHPKKLSVDIYQLAFHKGHIFYPALTNENHWVFLVDREMVVGKQNSEVEIRILDDSRKQLGFAKFQGSIKLNITELPRRPRDAVKAVEGAPEQKQQIIYAAVFEDTKYIHLHLQLDFIVERPMKATVEINIDGIQTEIGSVQYHYSAAPPLTPETILAIDSDPNSAKSVRITLGCKQCATEENIYTSIRRQPDLEAQGCIWQYDVGDQFVCACGKSSYSLKYVKESLHSLLMVGAFTGANISYVRQYAHAQIIEKIQEYRELLKDRQDERAFQEFIEENPIMLAQFRAKRISIRPSILGKHNADFAILDSQNQLILIELERPSLKLFKKDGHPTSDLMHAYSQVRDWMEVRQRHPSAFFEVFGLTPDSVMAVKGMVIAGRSTENNRIPLRRHLTDSPYPNVGFCTLDDLANSVMELSKNLA